jgi:predicted MPP superfamily phosphohydrolase
MSLFFLVIFAVYGGMHLYAYLRSKIVLGFGPAAGTAIAAFMLAMTFAPFFIRLFEKKDFELTAQVLSYISYFWMAALFLFFCSSIVIDLVNLLISAAARISGSLQGLTIRPKTSFFICLGLSLIICLHGFFSALNIRTERLRIETAKLPPHVQRLTIVQISDVHLGLIVRTARLKKILDIVKAEKPDIFISTGDLVDAQINAMEGLAELLREVKAPYGKYAITGNHEYYAGIREALAFTRECGFTVLRGEAAKNGMINIVGVDDPTGVQLNIEKQEPETALLSALPKDRFTLLLKHRPVVDKNAATLFDLQISGHTHRGQIYPFTYVSEIAYPLNSGRFDFPAGSILYVSRGSGTWGPPIRFLSPPEVTVYELVRKKTS